MNWWKSIQIKAKQFLKKEDTVIPKEDKWHIEYQGEFVGELVDPMFEEMFWVSYSLIPKNEKAKEILSTSQLWNECEFRFKHQLTSKYAENAIIGLGHILTEKMTSERILMRALYSNFI